MAHLDYLRELEMSGRIEEMLVHEAGNACLNHHQKVVFVSSYSLRVVVYRLRNTRKYVIEKFFCLLDEWLAGCCEGR